MRKLFIILLCLISFISRSFAQENTFDPSKFLDALKDEFKTSNREATKKAYDNFMETWENGLFTEDEQKKIVETGNMMFKNRYHSYPDFENYLKALVAYKDSAAGQSGFLEWHDALAQLIDEKRDFNTLNEKLFYLYTDKAIYESNTKNWYVGKTDFKLSMVNKEPFLEFDNIDLMCVTPGDTLTVYGTSGKLNVPDDKWFGKGGKITWERVKFNPNDVYATINNPYKILLKESEVSVDSATLHNNYVFDFPIQGKLHEKAFVVGKGENADYPQFQSYGTKYKIDNFSKNVTYIGGFSMQGAQVLGTGSENKKAEIRVKYNNNLALRAESDLFVISLEKIVAAKALVKIYFHEDSLYHPQVKFSFLIDDRVLSISRSDVGVSASPFYDSYHNLYIEIDNLEWNIDKPFVEMAMILNSFEPAKFTSDQFYNRNEYLKVQSVLDYNPLEKLIQYEEKSKSSSFTDAEFAAFMGTNTKAIQPLLIRLGMAGFILYQIDQGNITILDKVEHYVKAYKNKTDYDNLQIQSVISALSNATLDINSADLTIRGVGKVTISDSQSVYIFPHDQTLTVKKNRDMLFDGQILAGRFHFFGKNFDFQYDPFKFILDNVDSLKLYFPGKDGNMLAVKNVLQDISGTVYVDNPKNKSGRLNFSEYPIFDCSKEAMVYYDRPGIFNGVYDRNRFYFQVKPFKVDSLDNFTMKGVQFNGTFNSGNIFPTFDHYLYLMDDYSLGFETNTPEEGYPLYGGKGKGVVHFKLSNKGLRGSGVVDYLPSTTRSQKILFFLDSMNAQAETFDIPKEGQTKYPQVIGKNTYNHWVPYNDSMYIYKKDIPLLVYNEDFKFDGDLILTPENLIGNGTIDYQNSIIKSKALALMPTRITTDSASFYLKSDREGLAAFYSPNVKLDLDLNNNILIGVSNTNEATTSFQYNRYLTSIKEFRWDINEKSISMKTPPDQKIKDAYMVSTDPDQDSLMFNTTAAFFDLDDYTINAKNIPYISVADAQIYPEGKEVFIEKDAHMRSLDHAVIKVDTNYFFHEFKNSLINIFGQKKYTAYGTYEYVDMFGNKQNIFFKDIRVGEDGVTIAKGEITDSVNFYINPKFFFRGDVNLYAKRKELLFDGFAAPKLASEELRTQWFKYSDTVFADSFFVKTSDIVNDKDKPLKTGIFISKASNEIYTLFLGEKENPDDYEVFTAKGLLHYDFKESRFEVVDPDLLTTETLVGNSFTFDDQKLKASCFGNINFNIENKFVDLNTAGEINFNLKDTSYNLDVVMSLNFPFDEVAQKMMADSVVDFGFYLPDTKDDRTIVEKGIATIVKDKKVKENLLGNIESFGLYTLDKNYTPNFLMTDLQLKWDKDSSAFVSENGVGVGSIYQTNVNKKLKGGLLIKKKPTRETLTLLLESVNGNWYYFDISNERLNVLASDLEFNNQVVETFKKYSKGKFQIFTARRGNIYIFKDYVK